MDKKQLRIQVCYSKSENTILIDLEVRGNATIEEAILASGILKRAPEIDLATCALGVFGKIKQRDSILHDGDRVEIYRPLVADPKDARRARVAKKDAAAKLP